jgi:hypothetical protein
MRTTKRRNYMKTPKVTLKNIRYKEATDLLQKQRDGLPLNDIEQYKFNTLMAHLNEILAERRADVGSVSQYLNGLDRKVMVEATVNTLLTLIEETLKVQLKEGEHGDAIIDLYNSSIDTALPDALLKLIETGVITDVNDNKASK